MQGGWSLGRASSLKSRLRNHAKYPTKAVQDSALNAWSY
jgi:hypothetical protein